MKGFGYLRRAAELGDISACYFLGFSYHKGLFENDNPNAPVPTTSKPGEGGSKLCEKDITKCLEYLEKAASGVTPKRNCICIRCTKLLMELRRIWRKPKII